ncbi:hypothetical protein [Nonomuraea basaltis]|uniref:hypothetical protein n=1 Tax=Nonomuraea basaltis TaxID=2495887 RepID=UPI0014863843|nr:hypothetical protein [Nonomuraea basaltis]
MGLLLVACQVLIGIVFTVAAFTKLRSGAAVQSFAASLTSPAAHRPRPGWRWRSC